MASWAIARDVEPVAHRVGITAPLNAEVKDLSTAENWLINICRALIRKAGEYCARHGITMAVNMDGNEYQAGLMRDLALAGEMPVRVSLPLRLVAEDGPEGVARIDGFGPEVPGWSPQYCPSCW